MASVAAVLVAKPGFSGLEVDPTNTGEAELLLAVLTCVLASGHMPHLLRDRRERQAAR